MFAMKLLLEQSAQPDITWLLWVALGFFGLMVFVGWLVSRKRDSGAADANQPKEHAKSGHH